jgi:hypothetical protein
MKHEADLSGLIYGSIVACSAVLRGGLHPTSTTTFGRKLGQAEPATAFLEVS